MLNQNATHGQRHFISLLRLMSFRRFAKRRNNISTIIGTAFKKRLPRSRLNILIESIGTLKLMRELRLVSRRTLCLFRTLRNDLVNTRPGTRIMLGRCLRGFIKINKTVNRINANRRLLAVKSSRILTKVSQMLKSRAIFLSRFRLGNFIITMSRLNDAQAANRSANFLKFTNLRRFFGSE